MGAIRIFGITVERLCRRRTTTSSVEDPFPVDDEGFLDLSLARDRQVFMSPERAFQGGALVLLGEPGLGKTTVLDGLVARLSALGGEPVLVHGADLLDQTFDELVGRHLKSPR